MNGTKSEEVVEDFLGMLVDLTVNSKPLINFLTLLAKKHTSHAEAIVQAVGNHLRKVPSAVKLPVLYLIDSVMKNVGGNYIPLFSRCISKYFASVFKEADSKARLQLLHLRRTWNNLVFYEDLKIVDGQVSVLDQKWKAKISPWPFKQTSTKILVNPKFLPSAPMEETSLPVCADNISEDSEDHCSEMALQDELLLQVQQESKQIDGEGIRLESKNDIKSSLTNMVASDLPQEKDRPSNLTFQDAQVVQNQADSTTVESSMIEQGSKFSMKGSHLEPLTYSEKVSTHPAFVSGDLEHVGVTPPAATSLDSKNLQVKTQASDISLRKDLENYENSRKSPEVCSKPAIFCKPSFPCKEKQQPLETQCEALKKEQHLETWPSFSKSRSGAFSKTLLSTQEMEPSQVLPQNRRCYQWQPQVGSSRSKKFKDDPRLNISNVIPHLRHKRMRPLLPLPSDKFEREQERVFHSHNGVTRSSALRGSLNRWKSFRPSSEDFVVTLPQPSQAVLDGIDRDAGKTVLLNNEAREIQFYGNIAVVILSDSDVREISFQPGGAFIILNNVVVHCAFHEPERKIVLGNGSYRVRLGAPTRELYVNDEWFQCQFNGAPREIQLSTGEILMVRLQASTTPQVHIGSQRQDLIAGQVMLSIDSKFYVRLLLDSKPQRFDINGVPHVLQFADSLLTVLVNDQPVNLKFGGPPIPFAVNGGKHFVRLSELPKGIVPGEVNVSNFTHSSLAARTSPFPLPCYSPAQNLFEVPTSYLPFRRARGKKRDRLFRMQENSQRLAGSVLLYDNNLKHLSQEMNMMVSSCLSNVLTQNARAKYSESLENSTSLEVPPVAHSPVSGFDKPIYEPKVDVHALYQSLCASGLLTPRAKDQNISMESQKPPEGDAEEKIHTVDFKDATSLKVTQPGLVHLLYSGAQCSSCGTRYLKEESVELRKHLDWHFKQNNHCNKNSSKTQSRLWYCNATAWIESKDPLENKGCAWNETLCSADEDEWHSKNSISDNGLTYHPLCFMDIMTSANISKGIPFLEEMNTEDFAKDHPRDQVGLLLKPLRNVPEKENFPEEFDLQTSKPVLFQKVGNISQEIADSSCESNQEGKRTKIQYEGKIQEEEDLDISEAQANLDLHSPVLLHDKDLEGCHLSSTSLDKLCFEGFQNSPTDQKFQINQTSDRDVVIARECIVDSFNHNAEPLITKAKLKGRKLTQLPPTMKSSEISSLCSIA